MLELTIRRRGSLLNRVTEQTITEDQANSILAIAKAKDLTYGEVLAFLAGRKLGRIAIDYDAPTGAGDEVEAYRG